MKPRSGAGICVAVLVLLGGCSSSSGSDAASGSSPTADAKPAPSASSAPVLYEGYTSDVYSDPAHWLCRPDTDDICDRGLDATAIAADGTTTKERWKAAADPPVDCFYVYPTVSRDPGASSDLVPSPDEEGTAALNQVARLGSVCRVFAPVYRQTTLGALAEAFGGRAAAVANSGITALADVLDAWKQYMAHDNDGRGVVLVGHSQGAGMLGQLIRTEIDGHKDARDRLVSAYLAGSSVRVPEGADVGGDLANVPLCRSEDQVGCVVSWASFRSTSPPPPNTFFGRPRSGGGVTACNSPASLAGGKALLHAYLPANPVERSVTKVTTPFVTVPGMLEGECVSRDGVNYLEVTVHGDPADPRADDIGGDLTPEWGLHLVDVDLVMGNMVGLVARQAAAYEAAQ